MEAETESDQCYCGNLDRAYIAGTFQCRLCKKRFHPGCLHSAISSPLSGDTFYNFLCSKCGENNEEEYERSNISWQNVVMLALYNLQLGGGGKKGYFRWKEHICAFIDKHWDVLFGKNRKKTSLWHGTVAGTLSSGSPQHFLSGTLELGEHGWWKLAEMMPPTFAVEPASKGGPKRSKAKKPDVATTTAAVAGIITGESEPKRPRRSHSFSLNAAMELKAKRTDIKESKRNRRGQAGEETLTQSIAQSAEDSFTFSLDALPGSTSSAKTAGHPTALSSEPQTKQSFPRRPVISLLRGPADEESLEFAPSESSNISTSLQSSRSSSQADLSQDEDSRDSSSFFTQDTWGFVQQHKLDVLPPLMMDNEDDDIDIDPASMSPLGLDALQALENSSVIEEFITKMTESASIEVQEQIKVEESSVMKVSDDRSETEYEKERSDEEPEEESSDRESSRLATDGKFPARSKRQFRMSKKEATGEAEDKNERENLRLMSLYEEVALLKKLNKLAAVAKPAEGKEMLLNSEEEQLQLSRRMLRRKLIVRKLKREHGLPVFDLDVAVGQWVHKHVGSSCRQQESEELNPYASTIVHHPYGYARFLKSYKEFDIPDQYTSFYTRLMGFEDDQRLPITSPYTMRVLKPFIYRDSAISPQRVRLLQEIVAYPHRNDHSWQPPSTATIDYCYIRPQHIPSVNSMCRTFFWPGLDLSECLQYPDFSCVVMYKKLVVGFAFMVPDVKFNEAYISFIFTHPEWRNAGIAHFMLYHLIRTCMGKDVTLHVSVTNPAVLLYQKFGFKAEELCLDFYDKYFPVDSKECKHAFFMRLRR